MTNKQIIEMAKQAGIEFATHNGITGKATTFTLGSQSIDVMQRFAQLVRNEALEEAADSLYGNGLEMSLLRGLREEIKGLKS